MISIRQSFSRKLSLGILFLAVFVFVVSLGTLYYYSRRMIRAEAVERANSVVTATTQRLCRHITTIETATNANGWLVQQYVNPDSILAFSRRVVTLNPHTDGCSISTEPDVFPEYGRYFSAYTVREPDTITTVIEEQYEYFDKVWYKTPRTLKESCWVVYYDESDSLDLTIDGMIASYSKPLYYPNGRLLAVISTDLSLLRLSRVVTQEEKPYPNSYFMMLDNEGHYFIHPDTARLFKQTIFSGVDPHKQPDLITLGHEMTKGNEGSMSVNIDGKPCIVCYQPVPGTSWSLALVCPDSDIMARYHRLTFIVLPLLFIGLFVILFLCHRAARHAMRPINQLLEKTQTIAEGNLEVYIPKTNRMDAVGRLQNSFATMLQSLNFHMGSVRYITEQAHHRNEELEKATRLVKEAERQKTAFIQNVTHQIRTPLNIIMGFAQVLKGTDCFTGEEMSLGEGLSEDELRTITATMDYNSKLLNRLVMMLFDSSDVGFSEEKMASTNYELVSCNDVAREAVGYVQLYYPNMPIGFHTNVADDFCIQTSRMYLMRSLREILYNAAKYSDGKHVSMKIDATETTVRFIVEDTGKGISEDDRDLMFKFFTKVDDLSEGLGLGLPLAKRHAQNLGGDLTLDENYRKGCRFIIELPLRS